MDLLLLGSYTRYSYSIGNKVNSLEGKNRKKTAIFNLSFKKKINILEGHILLEVEDTLTKIVLITISPVCMFPEKLSPSKCCIKSPFI